MSFLKHAFVLDDLDVQLKFIYNRSIQPERTFTKLSLPFLIVWVVLSGRRSMSTGNLTYELKQGDVLIFPPHYGNVKLLPNTSDEPFLYIAVGLEARIGAVQLCDMYPMQLLNRYPPETPALSELSEATVTLEHVYSLFCQALNQSSQFFALEGPPLVLPTQRAYEYLRLRALIYSWLEKLFALLMAKLPEAPLELDPRVVKVCEYMKANLNIKLNIGDLAKHVYVSEGYLRNLFQQSLGMSPMDYIKQLRYQAASELLVGSSYTLTEIATLLGYEDQRQFSRSFKYTTGLSPKQFRKQSHALLQS